MNHFQQNGVDLYETQKQVLIEILQAKRAAGEIKSQEEYDVELQHLLSRLESGEPMMKIRKQEGQTNPQAFNETYQEISIDIMSAFTQLNKIDESMNKHQQLNQSIINNIKLSINKVTDDIARYESLVDSLTSDDLTFETFRDSNSFSSEEAYYTDRDGTALPLSYQVKLDMEREAVKLPTIVSQNVMIGPAGVHLAHIHIGKQLGGGLLRLHNPEHGIEKAIDTSFETFWSETILVDEPIRVPLNADYFHLHHGAVCELIISFDYLTQLNEISLQPFSEFPLDIVAIQYYETDDPTETAKTIVGPNEKPMLRSRSVIDSTSYQFDDVYAKRLRILLNQIHYIKTDFIYDKKESDQLALWYESKKEVEPDSINVPSTYQFKALYRNKAEQNPLYPYFMSLLKTLAMDIDSLEQTPTSLPRVMNKYAYSYGLYNIGVRKNEYQDKGIYVSKPLTIPGTVKAVTLEAKEEHPVLPTLDLRFTDIEYYITHKENPNPDEWFPIMPSNIHKIEAELVTLTFQNGNYQGHLRFIPKAGTAVVLRRNGIPMQEILGEYTVSGSTVTVFNYDVSAVYTAEYTPDKSAYTVDFLEKHTMSGIVQPNMKVEEFKGTNATGALLLRYYPFVDRAKLNQQPAGWNPTFLSNAYLPLKVKLIQSTGFHIDQPFSPTDADTVVLVNKTNYFDPETTILDPFDLTANNYQYKVVNNQIIFNTVLPETTRIIVEYPYLVGDIRLKAILRRNIQAFHGLTPVLTEYTMRYQRLL
jgi:hypothetical protein